MTKSLWTASFRVALVLPKEIVAESNEDAIAQMQALAKERGFGQLEVVDYGDEIHTSRFTTKGRRHRFMNLQLEGPAD